MKIDVIIIGEPIEYGIMLDDGGVVREPDGSIRMYL